MKRPNKIMIMLVENEAIQIHDVLIINPKKC
jgi:hypothetical protein